MAVGLGLISWLALRSGSSLPTANAAPSASVLTVEVVLPRAETWPQYVQASGPLEPWQGVTVSPETGGLRIDELLVDVGDSVKRGQLLARLADDSVRADLRKYEAVAAQAQANLKQATSYLLRAELIEGSGALSAQQIEDYRIAETTARAAFASAQADVDSGRLKLRQTRVVAPDDGMVASKAAELGNVVDAGAELFRLVRQGRIEWRPELDAHQLSAVRPGQPAEVTLPNGESVVGEVRAIGPMLSTSTGRAIVYVSLPKHSAARAGVFASGTIKLDPKPASTLPQSAIVLRDGRSYVFALEVGDKVASRAVTTGRREGNRIEVFSGIEPSERIVASGGAFLSDGARVTVGSVAEARPGVAP